MKILKLENVGCLKNMNNPIDLTKNAFIYGLNGVGKSTLKNLIVQSFSENGEITPVFSAKLKDCNAELEIFKKKIQFQNGVVVPTASRKIKHLSNIHLHVYDNSYVEKSIFVNGEITDNNKSEYFRILIGDEVNAKMGKILINNNNMKSSFDFLNQKITEMEKVISKIDELSSYYNDSIKLFNTKINAKYIASNIVTKKLKKNINDVNHNTLNWLNRGREFTKEDELCPYCGQVISKDLLEKLVGEYTKVYDSIQEDFDNYNLKIDDLILNIKNVKFDNIYFSECTALENLKTDLIDKLKDKKNNLAIKINFDNKLYSNLYKKYYYFKKFVFDLKVLIDKLYINDVTQFIPLNIDESHKLDKNVSGMKLRIINNIIDNSDILVDQITSMRNCFKFINFNITNILKIQQEKIVSNLKYINTKLLQYNFKYKLEEVDCKAKHLKNKSSLLLGLKLVPLNFENVKIKLDKKEVKSVLSEGEKSILSWVIFLLDIDEKINSGNHVIIIDDPISSYDSFRRFTLMDDLLKCSSKVGKIEFLILSHESSFSNVIKSSKNNKFKSFTIQNGLIYEIDIDNIIDSDYKNDLKYLCSNKEINSLNELMKFVIISRNVMDYYKSIIESAGVQFTIEEYEGMYEIASKIIHLQTNEVPLSFIDFISTILENITGNKIEFIISRDIDLNNINFFTELNKIEDIYFARVKINYLAIVALESNGINYKKDGTTKVLINTQKEHNLIKEEDYELFSRFMPYLNVFNHVNDSFGVRRVDCDMIDSSELFNRLNDIEVLN